MARVRTLAPAVLVTTLALAVIYVRVSWRSVSLQSPKRSEWEGICPGEVSQGARTTVIARPAYCAAPVLVHFQDGNLLAPFTQTLNELECHPGITRLVCPCCNY